MTAKRKARVLFVCTGNSCRSQMAEGWARQLGAAAVEVYSAGTDPIGVLPETAAAMAAAGVDISRQRSKSLETFAGEEFDYVITLCDNARERCPYFPGGARRLHWPIADPYGGGADAYRRARDEIRERVEEFLRGLGDVRRREDNTPAGA